MSRDAGAVRVRIALVLFGLACLRCGPRPPEKPPPRSLQPQQASAPPPSAPASPPAALAPPEPDATDWKLAAPTGKGGKVRQVFPTTDGYVTVTGADDKIWWVDPVTDRLVELGDPARRGKSTEIAKGSFLVGELVRMPDGAFIFAGSYSNADFGKGALPARKDWASFLALRGADGSTAFAVPLPTRLDELAFTPRGLVVGSVRRSQAIDFGLGPIDKDTNVLVAFDRTGRAAWNRTYPFGIKRLRPGPGRLFALSSKDDARDVWRHGLHAIDEDGSVAWERVLEAEVHSLAFGDGPMAVVGDNTRDQRASLGRGRLPPTSGIYVGFFEDPRGEATWVRALMLEGGDGAHFGHREVAVDPHTGHVVVAAIVPGWIALEPPVPKGSGDGRLDVLVLELDRTGALLWISRQAAPKNCNNGLSNAVLEPPSLSVAYARVAMSCHSVDIAGATASFDEGRIFWFERSQP